MLEWSCYENKYFQEVFILTSKFKTMDGNTAAAHVSYAFTEVAGYLPHHSVQPDG